MQDAVPFADIEQNGTNFVPQNQALLC